MREAKVKEKQKELENQLREKKTYIRGNLWTKFMKFLSYD